MDGVGEEIEVALRDSQSHRERLPVADASFAVVCVFRTTWHMGSGLPAGPTLLVDEARGDLRSLAEQLLSDKPQPPTPDVVDAMYRPPVTFLLMDDRGRMARPPMPEPDWERWSPSQDALDRAAFQRIGEVPALTDEEWQERLRQSRLHRP